MIRTQRQKENTFKRMENMLLKDNSSSVTEIKADYIKDTYYFKTTATPDWIEFIELKDMLCKNHTGKMENIISLSTSPLKNINCINKHNCNNDNIICKHCYSFKMQDQYNDLEKKLIRNTDNLLNRTISITEMERARYYITKNDIFRFEAFGDLVNEMQLNNYVRIAEHFPEVTFTLWTKNAFIVNKYFDKHDKPENMILIFSNALMDQPLTAEKLSLNGLKYFDKIFNVFSSNNLDPINCGKRDCNKCRRCYKKNTACIINELLK
jgi:hypothetical protein